MIFEDLLKRDYCTGRVPRAVSQSNRRFHSAKSRQQ